MDHASLKLDSIAELRTWGELCVEKLQFDDFRDESVLSALVGPPAAGSTTCPDVGTRLGYQRDVLARGLRSMRDQGVLRPDTDADELASGLLAIMLGGILIAKARKDAELLRTVVEAMMARVQSLSASGQGT